MRLSVCLCALALAVSAAAAALPGLRVSYIEGEAYAGGSTTWQSLSMGDDVPADSKLRLEAGARLGLEGMGRSFYLSQEGSYSLQDLLEASRRMDGTGLGRTVAAKLGALLSSPAGRPGSVAGVRGEMAGPGSPSAWVGSPGQEIIDDARDLLLSGEYAEAIACLETGLAKAESEDLPSLRYYLAYAYSLEGELPKAARMISGLEAGPQDPWAQDYVLLKAKLLLDTYAFPQAVQWLARPENDLSEDPRRGSLYAFLLGLGYLGMGDIAAARREFSCLDPSGPGSELAQAAERLLQAP